MKATATAVTLLLVWNQLGLSQQASPSNPAPAVQSSASKTVSEPAKAGVPPARDTLLDGTPVKLRLGETISSASAKTGQQVLFEVVEEVDVQGVPVIAKGGQALATVTTAETKKNMGRGGKLDVNIDSVRLIDSEKAQLRATQDNKGGGHVGAMTGAMVATAIVFFPAAPLFLFMKGKDITIPKGTEVTAFVQGDMRLNMTAFAAPGSAAPAGGAAIASSAASLTIDANVPGSDIEVDGQFVGNTPSTVSVAPGQHTIAVKKKGYAAWSRSINVSGSGVRLNAELEAKATAGAGQ